MTRYVGPLRRASRGRYIGSYVDRYVARHVGLLRPWQTNRYLDLYSDRYVGLLRRWQSNALDDAVDESETEREEENVQAAAAAGGGAVVGGGRQQDAGGGVSPLVKTVPGTHFALALPMIAAPVITVACRCLPALAVACC